MLIRRLKIKFLVSLLLSLILLITIFSTPVFASNDSDQARQSAKEILKQKKFSNQKNDAPLSKDFKRLSDWLGENKGSQKRISTEKRIQQTQQQSKPSNLSLPNLSGVGTILLIIIIALVVGAIGFFVVKIISRKKIKKKEKVKEDELNEDIEWDDEENILKTIDDADVLDNLADKALAEGKYDIALRYRFRAGLLRLDKIDAISFHPSITNNNYQLILNNVTFNSLVKSFNDVTYGKVSCDLIINDTARKSWIILLQEKSNIEIASSDKTSGN